MSNVDDLIRQLATDIDTLLHNAAVAKIVAFRLQWSGSYAMPALTDVNMDFTTAVDQTEGEGLVPVYSFADGITIPFTGLWHIESYSKMQSNNTIETALSAHVYVNGVSVRTTGVFIGDNPGYTAQQAAPWIGWLHGGDIVNGVARTNRSNVILSEQVVRIVGPLNLGSGLTTLEA